MAFHTCRALSATSISKPEAFTLTAPEAMLFEAPSAEWGASPAEYGEVCMRFLMGRLVATPVAHHVQAPEAGVRFGPAP